MALKRTKLLGIQNVTGINTVGILTVGVTQTAGGVGIASTTFLRGVVMHNTGLSTCQASLYIYDDGDICRAPAKIYQWHSRELNY